MRSPKVYLTTPRLDLKKQVFTLKQWLGGVSVTIN
jgi:hypothetical protein